MRTTILALALVALAPFDGEAQAAPKRRSPPVAQEEVDSDRNLRPLSHFPNHFDAARISRSQLSLEGRCTPAVSYRMAEMRVEFIPPLIVPSPISSSRPDNSILQIPERRHNQP